MDNNMIEILKQNDLKVTKIREHLLTAMAEYVSAMPYSKIQDALQTYDRVTLYRTIETLTERGIIHQAYRENNEVYYALCGHECGKSDHQHNHIHFKCLECELVTCQKQDKPISPEMPDFRILNVSIHVEGICKTCNAA